VSGDYHRPTLFEGRMFDAYIGGEDPARVLQAAHETAAALLDRGRSASTPELERVIALADEHGVDAISELWAHAASDSLPGALWRLYLLRALIRQDPEGVADEFRRGVETLGTADEAIAGAPRPAGPEEVVDLADRILRGAFRGDLGDALDRAASCCRILASGALQGADVSGASPEREAALVTRATRLSAFAEELAVCARRERAGGLD